MGCPAGQIEKFFPPLTKGRCMPEAQAKAIDEANAKAKDKSSTTTSNGLPKWVLDLLGNADKIGAGIGAATGKGGSTAPPVVITAPPTTETPAIPQWVWFAGAGLILVVVFAMMRKSA